MTIEEQAEIHGSLAEILTALAILVPKFGTEYGRMAAKHEARADRCVDQLELAQRYSSALPVSLIGLVTPPSDSEQTDDQPQEGSTEGEVPAQRGPEGEEGSEAEDEVTG